MTTRPILSLLTNARTAAKRRRGRTDAGADPLPDLETASRRLEALRLDELPWFNGKADLTPPDGGPEVVGPPVYSPPGGRRKKRTAG